jgi:hypothetical protein
MTSQPTGHQAAARLTAITGPYTLHPGPHLFTDWRFIEAGAPSYIDAAGEAVPLKGDGHLRPVWHRGINVPHGIRIVGVKPTKSAPIEGPMGASVVLDGGIYRSWSGANYSESSDGFHWTRPSLPGEPEGQDRNALFFNRTGVHGPGVFVDPSAPADERYKMIFWSEMGHGREELRERIHEKFRRTRPFDIDPTFDVRGRIDALFGGVSPDGIHWFKLPGGPVLEGDPETLDDGCLFTSCGLVPLPDGRVGVPYQGSTFPHKYPRWPDRNDRGRARYAVWQPGRLACVEAAGEGFFATPVVRFAGRQLRLNVRTPIAGEVRVEVVAISNWVMKKKTEAVVEGRSFVECDPLRGDHLSQVVTWRGKADLGHGEGQPVYFRFRLRAARLFAFELV